MAGSRFHHLSGATLAAALASATLLAGCGEHHVAPAQEASAPAMRPDALAGAPVDGPPPPAYAPPPPPAYAPPPTPAYGPPARPGDRDVIYDLGPVVRAHDTMAPIPNPPERGYARRPHARGPVHAPPHRAARPHAHPTVPRHAPHRAFVHPAPAPHAAARPASAVPHAAPAHGAPAKPAAHPAAPAHGSAPAAAAAHAPAKPHDAKPLASGASKTTSKTASETKTHGDKGKAPAPATGERATKLAALQTALKDAVAKTALLNAPELKPDQPADVTLTVPADFASVVRDESEKQGLKDAAASVNMTALLSGDGYAVAPDEVQSQPLTVGQPTEFHWTVTAQPGAKGGLHADVGADLLGGGDDALQLGSVTPAGKGGLHVSPKLWGAGLLVLLAVAVFGFLSRGRGAASARRRQRNTGLYQRPLDMGESAPPPPRTDREV